MSLPAPSATPTTSAEALDMIRDAVAAIEQAQADVLAATQALANDPQSSTYEQEWGDWGSNRGHGPEYVNVGFQQTWAALGALKAGVAQFPAGPTP